MEKSWKVLEERRQLKDKPHFTVERTREDDIQAEGKAVQECESPGCLGKGVDSVLLEQRLHGRRQETKLEGKLERDCEDPPLQYGGQRAFQK